MSEPQNFAAKKGPPPLPPAPPPRASKKAPPVSVVFDIRETSVCAQLKMNKDEVRQRRQYFLTQGHHWDYVDKRVMLSRIGAEILRGTKDAMVPVESTADAAAVDSGARRRPVALLCEKNPPPVKFEGKLIVWGAPGTNTRVVVCYLPGTDPLNPMNLVTLRVKENVHFMRGMKIPDEKPPGNKVLVEAVSDRENTYELLGPVPRYRGRW